MGTISLDDLNEVSARIVESLPKGSAKAVCLALVGDLGSGKTTLTQHIARHLGVTVPLPSPTFLLLRSYEIPNEFFNKLIHIDAYRIEDNKELQRIGFTELAQRPKTLIVVEWADRVSDTIPKDAFWLQLSHRDNDTRYIEAPWLE